MSCVVAGGTCNFGVPNKPYSSRTFVKLVAESVYWYELFNALFELACVFKEQEQAFFEFGLVMYRSLYFRVAVVRFGGVNSQ
jgi:hypothetical protein